MVFSNHSRSWCQRDGDLNCASKRRLAILPGIRDEEAEWWELAAKLPSEFERAADCATECLLEAIVKALALSAVLPLATLSLDKPAWASSYIKRFDLGANSSR
jgi:hypothetical protein